MVPSFFHKVVANIRGNFFKEVMQDQEERSCCPRCNDTRNRLYTRRVSGGWLRHCHNENCFSADPFLSDTKTTSPRKTLERLEIIKSYTNKKTNIITNLVKEIRIPKDFNIKIDKVGLLWLMKYGILPDEISTFGIGWSDQYQRLILPVFQGERLVYWQGRTFKPITKNNPKYLNIRQSGAKNVFFRRFSAFTKVSTNNCSDMVSLCIVEDILSAIKVGRYVDSLALLGSYLPKSITGIIKNKYQKVILWLDKDKYKTAIKEARKINELTGIPVKVICTEKDPKEISNEQLEFYLC